MKKQPILADATGREVVNAVPAIRGVKPVGSQVLIELLTPNEILGTDLHLGKSSPTLNGAPQAYILELGPNVDAGYGIAKGNRVVLSGSFTPLPEQASKNNRPMGVVEPHMIKAILLEA